MKTRVAVVALFSLTTANANANASPGALRIALEPGFASLSRPQEQRSWGLFGGASVAIGIADLLWIQVHVDHKMFIELEPQTDVVAWGIGAAYDFDIGYVTPSVEVALCGVAEITGDTRPPAELAPMFGGGVRFDLNAWWWLGAVFRYYPVFQSDIARPGYGSINLRLGFHLGPGGFSG